MFVSQSHSFTSQARLAVTLAWVAGYTNILTILTCGHVTSHVSGTTSDLGRGVVQSNWNLVGLSVFLLATFLFGAILSGLATDLGRRRRWESIYVLPMSLQALLLAAFAIGVELHDPAQIAEGRGLYVLSGMASIAMGVQNATITRISAGVVRTTHVTGVLTDLGLELASMMSRFFAGERGVRLRARLSQAEVWRPALLGSIIASFALGAGLGAVGFAFFPAWSMFPPVVFMILLILGDIRRPIAEIEPSDLNKLALDVDPRLAVFRLSRDEDRTGAVHRMPNIQVWLDHLPERIRIVILDLSDVREVEANFALELRASSAVLAAQRRHLLIAGVTPEQFQSLRKAAAPGRSGLPAFGTHNVSADLELALAQGLNMLHHLDAEALEEGRPPNPWAVDPRDGQITS